MTVLVGEGGGSASNTTAKSVVIFAIYYSLFVGTHDYLFCPGPACDGVWLGNEPGQTLADGVPVSRKQKSALIGG